MTFNLEGLDCQLVLLGSLMVWNSCAMASD